MNKSVLKWNFIFQYGWVLTNIVNSLLLLPLYLRNIHADTLGIWLASGSLLNWITLVDPGVGEVLQQKIAEAMGQERLAEVKRIIGSGFASSVFIFIFSVIVGFIGYFFLEAIIDKDISQYAHLSQAVLISILATGLSLVSFSLSGINQGLHNSMNVAVASLSANFLFLLVNVLFLYMGYGVLSIALANLARAVYINIYNLVSLVRVQRRMNLSTLFEWSHFRKFIRIFSFTSASRIISGIAYSIDMLVLARFIAPAQITMYEINRRPVNITYSLVGRHSVALMPVLSHAKGKGEYDQVSGFIHRQFRYYFYIAVLFAFFFYWNFDYIIGAWAGPGQFAGMSIGSLLILNFFASLMSYFMAIVGYALGDIKMNSLYNIIRGLFYGVCVFFAARYYGISGAVVVSLFLSATTDFVFYTWRLRKLGFFKKELLTQVLRISAWLLPALAGAGWLFRKMSESMFTPGMYFNKLLLNGGLGMLFFASLVMIIDGALRRAAWQATSRYIIAPLYRMRNPEKVRRRA